ncbi:MAG: methionyl-tRNA formyltransferase [Bifidobacterium subtile]|jgi:methionyl-tRNA formyltransferase|uniref:methionyl-tRNA formyltransferase n=1 Tax=Bifidobacterium subtile TaxID=77635 RepID=UPI002F35AC0A|nr:methionyl-tRNA formyltransferase [Bifidobacterium subtile]MCI1241358.1 methionyl-tRNA formyltransferase [Bifidobacterium subtile]MCI1258097.1 methionyl-tRNA formyltransferase [Bifidobacterium subtile]
MVRVLFAGTPDVAVPSLRTLAGDPEHFEVVAVLTRPDAPRGRGRRLEPSPVKQAALELGLPVLECDPNEPAFVDELLATGAEAAAVVAYGRILKESVLEALPMGWYNLHFSLLPQWRGAAPVQRAIWAGDTLTGATVFRITRGMDSGPILAQSTIEIGPHETAGDLLARLAEDGSRLLAAALQAMADGQIQPVEQQVGAYEIAEKIRVEDAHIRFDVPAFAVDRQIRACTPNPGAWCLVDIDGTHGGNSGGNDGGNVESGDAITMHVLQARVADAPGTSEGDGADTQAQEAAPADLVPGAIATAKQHVWVGTASDPIELLQVKAQGKKAMAAADWARGARLTPQARCR